MLLVSGKTSEEAADGNLRDALWTLSWFLYHCFDRIVIQGYLPPPTRPEHIVHFFRDVHGQYPIAPQVLAKRTLEYRGWVEGYARNHIIPPMKAEKGVSKEKSVVPGVYAWYFRDLDTVRCSPCLNCGGQPALHWYFAIGTACQR